MSANLNKIDASPVSRVAMPLVRLLRTGNLSWADKAEVADTIADLMRHKRDMENEASNKELGQMLSTAQKTA